MKMGKSLLLVLAIWLSSAGFCLCDTHYVWKGGSSTSPYSSLETAATSIQSAVDAADPGDTVFLAAGEYAESIVLNKEGLSLVGENALITRLSFPLGDDKPAQIILALNTASIRGVTIAFRPDEMGAGIVFRCPSGSVRECIFAGAGDYYSTAIRCESFSGQIVNCLISGFGYGMNCEDSDATILNCTICSNVVGVSGGFSREVFPVVVNSIVWYNHEQLKHYYGAGPSARHSDIQGDRSGDLNISTEPRFVSLEKGILRLRQDSPCIDVGDGLFPELPETDLEGKPRIHGAGVDMGAYEYSPSPLTIMTDSLPAGAIGVEYILPLRATGGFLPYRWAGEGLPEGLSVEKGGAITGVPAATGAFTVTLVVWDNQPSAAAVRLQLEVRNPICVSALAPEGGDGSSWDEAFNTIQEATVVASAGDTIRVGAGRYPGEIQLPDEVSLVGEGGGETVVVAPSSEPYWVVVQAPRHGLVEGIAVEGGFYGIRCDGGAPVIRRCSVIGTSYEGIAFYGGCFGVIENCATYFNNGNGIHFEGSSHGEAVNCTSYGNTWDGFSFDRSSPRLVNCVSWGNGFNLWTYGGWGESSPTISYSNIEEGFEGEGNIAEDPLFVAEDDGILFLCAGSPCIDAGKNPVACSSLDVAGDERVVGGNIDMGAYEFGKLRAIPPANRNAVEGLSYEASLHATGGRPPYTWQATDPPDMILTSGGELSWQPSEHGRRTISALLTDSQGSQKTLAFVLEVARPIYVDWSVAESGDGSSLQQAFRTIREALDIASPGEAVVVASGTYGESVRLKDGVDVISLSGPQATSIICPDTGRGTAAVLFGELSDSLSEPSSTGSIAGALRDGDLSFDSPSSCSPRVEGFTLKGGWAGVIFAGRSAEVFNCIISGEQSGFYCRDAQGRLDKCVISNSDWGIACTSGEPRVTRSIISGCRLGVYADPGSPLLRNCVIVGNFWSGIEFAEASCPVAIDCILWDNVQDLCETGGSVQVRRSIVKDYFFTETNGNAFLNPLFVGRGDFSREIWVDPSYPHGDSDGTWEKPYASISAALASLPSYDYHLSAASPCLKANGSFRDKGAFPGEPPAASPDSSNIVIHLTPGTYREGPILLRGHITLRGAGVGQTVMEPPEVEYWHDYVLVAGNGSLISDVRVSGSGISFAGSDVTISDCFVTRFVCISHHPLILRCKASGFYISGGSPTILNCLACDGYTGMEFDNSSAEVINCTVSSNNQGIVCSNYGGRAPSFRNCIIWGNWVDIPTPDHGQVVPIFSYCDIRHGWPGRGNIGSDPLFIPGSGCRLSSNSPCIDAGDPASDYSMEPQPNGGRINMGAYGNTIYAATSATVDADADGMRDNWERQNFQTTDFDPAQDTDGDGLTEYQEHLFRTNPFLSDSDGDGHSDAAEVAEGTDPADPGDPFRITGMSRGEGIVQITYPVVPGYRYWVWSTDNLRGEWQRSTVSYYCNIPEAPRTQELESLQHKKHFIKVEKAFP